MSRIQVLIVEDEPLIAEDIAMALESIDYAVAGVAYRVKDALQLLEKKPPDILLLDINLAGGEEGIALAHFVNEHYKIPFVYLTSYGDKHTLNLAKATDPAGYLVKPFHAANLFASLQLGMHNFLRKNKHQYPDLIPDILNRRLPVALTEREFDVLHLIYNGDANQVIADTLFVSVNTVKKHINNAYLKMDVSTRGSAIARLRQLMQEG